MPEENEVQTLLELGLTNRQIRVFLELLKHDALTAKAVAVALNLPSQDTYTVLDKLKALGLIEKQLDANKICRCPSSGRFVPLARAQNQADI